MKFDINSIPGFDAQAAHVASGVAVTLAAALFLNPIIAIAISTAVCFGKEALEAIGIAPWEPKQSWSSSLVDFKYFGYGIAGAALLLLIKSFAS